MSVSALLIAFLGGLVSFISPCVIPLLPAYLSFLTGLTPEELKESSHPGTVFLPALLFVLGFTLVFVAMGATASLLGSLLRDARQTLTIVGGVLIIAFGVFMLDVIPVPWLYQEKRLDLARVRSFGGLSGLFLGMAFAAGWTPCIGPVLGSILALAGSSGSSTHGVALLLSYSLGLGVPFILFALFFEYLNPYARVLARYSRILNRVAGVILIVIGALMVTGVFSSLSAYLSSFVPTLELGLPRIQGR